MCRFSHAGGKLVLESIPCPAAILFAAGLVVSCHTATHADAFQSSVEQYDIPESVIAWFSADGSTIDVVSGENGRIEGKVGYEAGLTGGAFRFWGRRGQIFCELDKPRLLESFSIEAWVKHTAKRDRVQTYVVADAGQSDSNASWAALRYAGLQPGLHFYLFRNLDEQYLDAKASRVLRRNLFHHVVGTYSPLGIRLYCDGLLVGYNEETNGPYTIEWISIGHDLDRSWLLIDDVRIHNRALYPSEITSIYRAKFPNREPFGEPARIPLPAPNSGFSGDDN